LSTWQREFAGATVAQAVCERYTVPWQAVMYYNALHWLIQCWAACLAASLACPVGQFCGIKASYICYASESSQKNLLPGVVHSEYESLMNLCSRQQGKQSLLVVPARTSLGPL